MTNNRIKRISSTLPVFLGILLSLFLTFEIFTQSKLYGSVYPEANSNPLAERVAYRLRDRIQRRFGAQIQIEELVAAVQTRQRLLSQNLTLRFLYQGTGSTMNYLPWQISLQEHNDWVSFVLDGDHAAFKLNEETIASAIQNGEPTFVPRKKNAIMLHPKQDRLVMRGEVFGQPSAGFTLDGYTLAKAIADAYEDGRTLVEYPVTYESPDLIVQTASGQYTLSRLSVGRSDFARSPIGRVANIKKGLQNRIHGSIFDASELISFNNILVGEPNWQNALVIVNGKDLVMEPGGGICQVATTVYRAVLLAGLPVFQRKNHSLYVSYYKKYGVGIDATVYAKKQDLTFQNDTNGKLVLLAWVEGTEAVVEVYGEHDGRTVSLDGPYFAQTAPSGLLVNGRLPRTNEIIWQNTVSYANGNERKEVVVSAYSGFPRSLYLEYPQSRGVAELHKNLVLSGSVLPQDLLAAQ